MPLSAALSPKPTGATQPRPSGYPLMVGHRRQLSLATFLLCFALYHSCELFWKGKQSLGFDNGIQLQVCCNVSKVRIWPLGRDFSVGEKAIDQSFPEKQDDMWAELQLSICSDRREATIGWVIGRPGVTCQHKTGQTLTLSPAYLPLPGWYVICYSLVDGCQTCSIDMLCSNDLSEACSAVTVLGSSPSATNSTINYWTKVGKDYPFPASASSIELTVEGARDRKEATKKVIPLKVGVKSDTVLNGLSENEIYTVRRCIVVELPPSLTSDSRFTFSSKRDKICVEEGYRTERSSSALQLVTPLLAVVSIYFL